ncbi:hypothetical protein [Thermophagus xiamenensis]|uniref:Uncharacterized protein n=1 Tax=Thermophagus xiamenensis TaxID=385682 RepID=A0A1I1Z5H5_9BACT|nr:hypothetical protein [Thermophagus xiamenensis]SFE26812.1 hypothetical protein SAMN05444380_1096 [Thermophagus xiamenensis]
MKYEPTAGTFPGDIRNAKGAMLVVIGNELNSAYLPQIRDAFNLGFEAFFINSCGL